MQRRSFERKDGVLHDTYVDAEGEITIVNMPEGAMRKLCWRPGRGPVKRRMRTIGVTASLEAMLARWSAAPEGEVGVDDLLLVARVGDDRFVPAVERQLMAMNESGRVRKEATRVAAIARCLLALVPWHVGAARALAELLFARGLSDFERTRVAAHLAQAFLPTRRTDAMNILQEALLRLLNGSGQLSFGPQFYSCVGPLFQMQPDATLRRCRAEFARRKESARSALIANMRILPGSDVLAVLYAQIGKESSPRLRFRLMTVLGQFVNRREVRAILKRTLADESPWWRWQAVQELWRVECEVARRHATELERLEPDPLLRRLLRTTARVSEQFVQLGRHKGG
jgi:hypothetical protein